MAKKETTTEKNAAAVPAAADNQNNAPATISTAFAALEVLESKPAAEMIELTSELLKLEAGESFVGLLTNQTEMMESQDEDGKPFECAVLFAKNKSKVLCADAVVVSTQKRIFGEVNPASGDISYKAIRMESHGMRKSASNATREYRDIKIYTL